MAEKKESVRASFLRVFLSQSEKKKQERVHAWWLIRVIADPDIARGMSLDLVPPILWGLARFFGRFRRQLLPGYPRVYQVHHRYYYLEWAPDSGESVVRYAFPEADVNDKLAFASRHARELRD